MTENHIYEFICLIQRNNYKVKLIKYDTSTFKKVLTVEPKCFLVPKILISFTDISRSKGRDFLDEVEALNKQVNNNKSLIVILIMPMDSELSDNLWFNGNVFVHLVLHNEKLNCICFEKNFHYLGAKCVRNLIDLLKQSLN
ncbi:MAG: hypothetical protein CVU97_05830 [Firmicutes bacterium HGW-Firmicutes-21]|nr:MAG: hypothetical protein CVU97_05830 [Firmicutes bacterium HGW-Firmicutes-21]